MKTEKATKFASGLYKAGKVLSIVGCLLALVGVVQALAQDGASILSAGLEMALGGVSFLALSHIIACLAEIAENTRK